jgi:hypothetical protein
VFFSTEGGKYACYSRKNEKRGGGMRKILIWGGAGFLGLLLLVQLYRPERTNPAVDSAMTIQARLRVPENVDKILRRSCYDCHSHETRWPWYSHVAPSMWLVARDVEEGRSKLNFSNWTYRYFRAVGRLDQMAQEINDGEMPLPVYLLMHPSARLTEEEKNILYDWVESERDRILEEDAEE